MLTYTIKRVIRSFGLFAALLLGVVLAATFFAGVNIGADTTAKAALNQQLNRVPVDIVVSSYGSPSFDTADWLTATSEVASVNGINRSELVSRAYWYGNTSFANYTSFRVVGVSESSRVYDGLTVTSGSNSLGVNETYVWMGSKSAERIPLNSTLTMNFTFTYWNDSGYKPIEIGVSVSLKFVGFVELDDKAFSIATGNSYGGPVIYQSGQEQSRPFYDDNLIIVDWNKTIRKLMDEIPDNVPQYANPVSTQILAYVNREALINPWDVSTSISLIRKITDQVTQKVAIFGMSASNNLEQILFQYEFTSMTMRFSFFIVALPVFFVAWYVGTTVSDVSYNLRRREIGLLMTKGFSTGQLFRMFLTESVFIGVIGGLMGVGLGFVLSPVFAAAVGGGLGGAPVLNYEVIIIAVVFSLVLTLLSTFRPSRRASKLPAVDALREYMYVEDVKPYKQRWPWLAFALGTYKIVMFAFGISLIQLFATGPPPFTNIFLVILLAVWLIIDTLLAYIGPLLFFWGFSKIFIRGSLKFQELVTRFARFLGDLGTLATKNVRRNPARAASVAFLIALIVGYSFQTVGSLASEQDYIIRRVKADVGADISMQADSTANVSKIITSIEALQGVANATWEYSLSMSLPGQYYSNQIRAVDPYEWLATAYYEDEWFSGNDVATAFQKLNDNNHTIVLERNIAKNLDKKIGDPIALTVGTSVVQLTIVGFFGPEVVQTGYIQPVDYFGGVFWSYVSTNCSKILNPDALSSPKLLMKLESGADAKSVASSIADMEDISAVRSTADELENYQSNLVLTGSLNIQRIGVVFSILAAAVATSLVTLVSLQERKKEASIMSARGLSYKQLVTMFFAENLAIVVFSVFLGMVVGLIVVRGNVAAANSTVGYSLVAHRIAFPLDATILLSTCVLLVFASAIIPVLLLTKRYVSKIERIVRL
jgi:ABC-type antimicrobial peptide transport system permease subunit